MVGVAAPIQPLPATCPPETSRDWTAPSKSPREAASCRVSSPTWTRWSGPTRSSCLGCPGPGTASRPAASRRQGQLPPGQLPHHRHSSTQSETLSNHTLYPFLEVVSCGSDTARHLLSWIFFYFFDCRTSFSIEFDLCCWTDCGEKTRVKYMYANGRPTVLHAIMIPLRLRLHATCSYADIHAHTHIHVLTHTHTCMHTHTHTLPHSPPLDTATAVATDVTATILAQRMELDNKTKTVEMLQKALSQQRELTVYHAKEMEKEGQCRLELQRQEYETTVQRHQCFIDQVCVGGGGGAVIGNSWCRDWGSLVVQ